MMRTIARLLLAFGLLAGFVWMLRPAWRQYQGRLDQRRLALLAAQAERADTATAARALVRRVREAPGDDAPTLARLAASPREDVAAAAREAIDARLAAALHGRSEPSEHRRLADLLATLARSLAENADQYQGWSAPWAKRTAARILAECDVASASQLLEIAANCEAVVALVSSRPDAAQSTSKVSEPERQAPTDVARQPTAPAAQQLPGEATPLRGAIRARQESGALPDVEPAQLPPASVRAESQNPVGQELTWTPKSVAPPRSASAPPAEGDAPQVSDSPPAADLRVVEQPPQPHASSSAAFAAAKRPTIIDVPSPEVMRHRRRQLALWSREQLLQELNAAKAAAKPYLVAAIERELQRRGVSTSSIKLVSQPRSTPIDTSGANDQLGIGASTAQLYELTRHKDPTVRRRALSLLATADDPNLPAIARQRAVHDEDADVADLALKLLQQRVRR